MLIKFNNSCDKRGRKEKKQILEESLESFSVPGADDVGATKPVKPITIFCDRALCPSGSTTKRGVIEAIDQPRRESLEEKDRRRSRKMFADRVSLSLFLTLSYSGG